MNYLLHLLIYFEIYAMVALSLNLIVGYCGLLTLAHAGYFAVGAYAYAVLSVAFGWEFIPAVMAAMFISAGLSLATSLPAWRLRGDFFVLATLAVQALIFSLLYNWVSPSAPLGSWSNLTNGPFGISRIPRPTILGWAPTSTAEMAILVSLVAVGCAAVLWRLQRSAWGRLLMAARDDELALRNLGRDVFRARAQAVAIACALVAIAGALYASHVRYLDPSSASLDEGILMLSMVIVGGLGNFRGPLVGAATLIALPELLRLLQLPDSAAAALRLAVYGLLLVALMHWRPKGLAGTYRIE
jgi:branched-chain amino acid transport system permease protein